MMTIERRSINIGFLILGMILLLCIFMRPIIKTLSIYGAISVEPVFLETWSEEMDLILQAVVIDSAYTHAMEEHSDTADIVHECLKKNGQYIAFQIERGKRYLRVCLIDAKTIGFQIVDIVGKIAKERTAYVKDTIKSLKELFDYARRMGYPRFAKPF